MRKRLNIYDKTGTLTHNQMKLSKCSIDAVKYRLRSMDNVANDYKSFTSLIE